MVSLGRVMRERGIPLEAVSFASLVDDRGRPGALIAVSQFNHRHTPSSRVMRGAAGGCCNFLNACPAVGRSQGSLVLGAVMGGLVPSVVKAAYATRANAYCPNAKFMSRFMAKDVDVFVTPAATARVRTQLVQHRLALGGFDDSYADGNEITACRHFVCLFGARWHHAHDFKAASLQTQGVLRGRVGGIMTDKTSCGTTHHGGCSFDMAEMAPPLAPGGVPTGCSRRRRCSCGGAARVSCSFWEGGEQASSFLNMHCHCLSLSFSSGFISCSTVFLFFL